MEPQDHWAHTRVDASSRQTESHGLAEHLRGVASLAAEFTQTRAPAWARLAGLWHDLGKYRPGFQRYIRQVSDAHIEGKLPASSDKTHSAAGALHALRVFESAHGQDGARLARVLAYVIAGHHAGLADWTAGLDARLLGTGAPASEQEYREAIRECQLANPQLLALPPGFDLREACLAIPGVRGGNPLAWSLWIRMLFSALVDADFLDTEAFMDISRAAGRTGHAPLADYLHKLNAHLGDKAAQVAAAGRQDDPVMQARALVLQQCRAKAASPPGVFSLTVPTGGGKTLSSLAFALRHACQHGKKRVIYAIPYTSIIEQTAEVFSGIFGPEAVVEHHSQVDIDEHRETARTRLACENWDAPLIVTTNVQLFESLFAARTSRCRKLHRIADSVIVLDEAQCLPPEFLQPILDTLSLLTQHYGVTVLLCTATQPTLGEVTRFDPRQNLRGLPTPTRVITDETRLFDALRRVHIEWPADLHTALPTDAIVQRVAAHDSVLVIVNTRRDAADIVAALDAQTGEKTLHLSAALCGQHRADVIREIRARLAARSDGSDTRPLRVVSTQIVEAGVDLDFPTVYRALAGLDSIAQAAGRCNREGLAEMGRVVVFVRDLPMPLQALRLGAGATRSVLATGLADALSPAAFERYFPLYYAGFQSRDRHGIVEHLRNRGDFAIEFRSAADKFRLVDDADQASVIVPYASSDPNTSGIQPLLDTLQRGEVERWLLRKLQRYTVNTRKRAVDSWMRTGDVREIQPGIYLLVDGLRYDNRYGLITAAQMLDPEAFVQ